MIQPSYSATDRIFRFNFRVFSVYAVNPPLPRKFEPLNTRTQINDAGPLGDRPEIPFTKSGVWGTSGSSPVQNLASSASFGSSLREIWAVRDDPGVTLYEKWALPDDPGDTLYEIWTFPGDPKLLLSG